MRIVSLTGSGTGGDWRSGAKPLLSLPGGLARPNFLTRSVRPSIVVLLRSRSSTSSACSTDVTGPSLLAISISPLDTPISCALGTTNFQISEHPNVKTTSNTYLQGGFDL